MNSVAKKFNIGLKIVKIFCNSLTRSTVWRVIGIWGSLFRSKCSVGTAGRKKISKCWLQETNNFLEIICHFDLTYNITEFWQLIYLVSLVLRSLPYALYYRWTANKRSRFLEAGRRRRNLLSRKKLNHYFGNWKQIMVWCGDSSNHMEF